MDRALGPHLPTRALDVGKQAPAKRPEGGMVRAGRRFLSCLSVGAGQARRLLDRLDHEQTAARRIVRVGDPGSVTASAIPGWRSSRSPTFRRKIQGGQGRAQSYQRLEFLGDRVLGVVIASRLYQAFPKASEGELSMRFAKLVRRETCAEIAAQWDVGPHVALGLGEARGRRPQEGRRSSPTCANP